MVFYMCENEVLYRQKCSVCGKFMSIACPSFFCDRCEEEREEDCETWLAAWHEYLQRQFDRYN